MAMSNALGAMIGLGGALGGSSPEDLEKYQKERENKAKLAEEVVGTIAATGMTVSDASEVLYLALGMVQKAANSRPLSDVIDSLGKES